jgi:hypothetical protein
LWEKSSVKAKIEHVAHMGYLSLVDIDNITDILESKERNTNWKQDNRSIESVGVEQTVTPLSQMVYYLDVCIECGIVNISEEIGIFEITQDRKVDDDTKGQYEVAASVFLSGVHPFPREEIV